MNSDESDSLAASQALFVAPPARGGRRLNVRLRCENDDEDENGGDIYIMPYDPPGGRGGRGW